MIFQQPLFVQIDFSALSSIDSAAAAIVQENLWHEQFSGSMTSNSSLFHFPQLISSH